VLGTQVNPAKTDGPIEGQFWGETHVLAADPVSVAAQRINYCLGTGAEIEAPKALRSKTLKASRKWGMFCSVL